MRKLINFKEMTLKQKIIFLLIIIAILIILTWILRIRNQNRKIENSAIVSDYSQIQGNQYFTSRGFVTYDRQIYWDLNDIISNFIISNRFTENDEEYFSGSYYNALTEEYKRYLGESKYNELAQKFFEKFLIKGVQEINYKTYNFIDSIYDMGQDTYFCEMTGTNENKAYIGIRLHKSNKTFEIFYIE